MFIRGRTLNQFMQKLRAEIVSYVKQCETLGKIKYDL